MMSFRLKLAAGLLSLVSITPAAAQTVEYLHTDALGSVVAATDANRNIVERREYEPYGYQLTPAAQNGPGYTGHVQDAATGLTYMQQRYYDPVLGRFLSVDPVTMHDSGDARHFNRYGYANNNPYTFVDPDGRQSRENVWIPDTGHPLFDWLKTPGDAQGSTSQMLQKQAAFELSQPQSAKEVVLNVATAMSAGTLGLGRGALARRAASLGDLTRSEVAQIQGVVNKAGRPLDVVGSAASGTRRGVDTDLPIGKGPGTRSDIDYTTAGSNVDNFDGLQQDLPSVAPHGILQGTPEPGLPSIRFEPKL